MTSMQNDTNENLQEQKKSISQKWELATPFPYIVIPQVKTYKTIESLIILSVFIFLLFPLIFASSLLASQIQSPLNHTTLDLGKNEKYYSFIITGHIYGAHSASIYPAASILGSIDLLNSLETKFMILLGDIVHKSNSTQIKALKNSFLSKLSLPVFNARGNHDAIGQDSYKNTFGPNYSSFQVGSELFLFLDSELGDGQIEGPQLEFALKEIRRFGESPRLKNIFIFTHRLLWAIENPPYNEIIPFTNGPGNHRKTMTSVRNILIPKLKIYVDKQVFFVSGDIGARLEPGSTDGSLTIFYEEDPNSNVTYVANGLGDTENDSVLLVNIKSGKKPEFRPISLTHQNLPPIEDYDIASWKNQFGDRASIIFKKILRIVTHRYFLLGYFSGIFVIGSLFFLKKLS
jgi:hypothetical protein